VKRLVAALEPDDVVLGGGNVRKLKKLPAGCRAGDNANAFLGGFRLWEKAVADKSFISAKRHSHQGTRIRSSPRKETKASQV